MLKKFFENTAIYSISSLVSGSLIIILLPFLSRKLTLEEYGIMDLLLSTFTIVNFIVPLNISQALARYYHSSIPSKQQEYASTGLWFTIISYTFFLGVTIINIHPLNHLLIGDNSYVSALLFSLVSMLTYGVFSFLQNQLRWMNLAFHYMLTSVVFVAVNAALTVFFISNCKMSIDGFFLARIISSLIAGFFCWSYSNGIYKLIFNFSLLKTMINFSFPLVFSSIAIFVSLYIDRFFIRSLLSLTDLGIYSGCARIASLAGNVITVINFSLTPIIYANYHNPKAPIQLALIFKILFYTMLISFLFLLIFSDKIIVFLIGERYSEGRYILPLLVASFIITGLYNCAPGLWIANKTKLIAYINIISALLNTGLCIILIPFFGFVGASMATLLSSILTLIISTRYAQKYYFISYDWVKINLATILTLVFSYLILRT